MEKVLSESSYVTLQSFMVEELGLSGNELIAFALINGFSQDGVSEFSGTASYVARWCGVSEDAAIRILGRLVSKGLLSKRQSRDGKGHKRCFYSVANRRNIGRPTDETSVGPTDESSVIYPRGNKDRDKSPLYSPQVADVVEHMNSRLGTRFSPKTKQTRESINARLSDGYTVKDMCDVVDSKADEWASDPKMSKYLNPTTLFRPGNFERYVNALRVSRGGVPDDFSAYR